MLASKLKFSSVSICKMSSALELSRLLQFVVPSLSPERHKGQAGKIAVIGGCREYTGAPYFSAISALKVGADLSHVFCSKGAGTVIKSYSPELIVHPILVESYDMDPVKNDVEGILGEFMKWLPRFDCLVVGPGLGRDPLLLNSVSQIICQARKSNVPIVLDGDGLFLVTNNPELVSGYALAILTPNVNEHKRLVEKVLGEEHGNKESDASEQLMSLAARLGGVTIVQKGMTDLISDGNTVYAMSLLGSPRRCGGQGDVLSGSIAVFTAWSKAFFSEEKRNMGSAFPTAINNILQKSSSNPAMLGGIAGSFLVRAAAAEAYEKHQRSTLTTDIINCLGTSMDKYFPIRET